MRHPLTEVPHDKRRSLFVPFLFFTILVMVVLNTTGTRLVTDAAPAGIVSYELAREDKISQDILDSWDGITKIYAGFNLGLDYLFLFLYSTTIAMAIIWLVEGLNVKQRIRTLSLILATGLTAAAVLDAIGNWALFVMLVDGVRSPFPQIAYLCAVIKFSLVFMGLASVIIGMIVYFLQARGKSK